MTKRKTYSNEFRASAIARDLGISVGQFEILPKASSFFAQWAGKQ